MPEITAAAVKALRDRTDLPMMNCKQALIEAGGDEEKAVEILRRRVKGIIDKRGANATKEGVIRILIKDDGSEASMVELQCETAPVASNDGFRHLAEQCAEQLLKGPGASTPEELLQQPAPAHAGKTLNDLYEETVNKISEKIVLSRITRVPGPVAGYVHHDQKTGVLLQATGDKPNDPVLRDVAMHIAALRPRYSSPDEIPAAEVAAERARLTDEAKQSGKPDNIVAKIVDGRMNAFYVEQGVLPLQPFAKDDTKTVSQALAERGLKVKGFVRWVLGT